MPRNSNTICGALLTAGIALTVLTGVTVASPRADASVLPTASTARTAPGQPRFGDTGPKVVALQKAIIRNGFTLRGGPDGVFDARTRKVLRTFQRVVGLRVTGVVDKATAGVLKLASAQDTGQSAANTPVEASYPFSLETLPSRGQRGKAVRKVQRALAAKGLDVQGGIDGFFGRGTTATISAFQQSAGIPQTGILDAATAVALGLIAPAGTPVASSDASSVAPVRIATSSLPKRGDRGDSVRVVQTALVNAGVVIKGGIDGVFGGATAVAIRKFQETKAIPATGLVDLRTAIALGVVEQPSVQLKVFPVQGLCSFSNTWHAPRPGGRVHLGVDIIAKEGNLLYAVTDGVISKVYDAAVDVRAGNGVRLLAADGTYFFYGHMKHLAEGIALGSTVKAGQVLGYVGKTGDTNTPHLHFEIHPGGGDAIDPTDVVSAIDACGVTQPLPVPVG